MREVTLVSIQTQEVAVAGDYLEFQRTALAETLPISSREAVVCPRYVRNRAKVYPIRARNGVETYVVVHPELWALLDLTMCGEIRGRVSFLEALAADQKADILAGMAKLLEREASKSAFMGMHWLRRAWRAATGNIC